MHDEELVKFCGGEEVDEGVSDGGAMFLGNVLQRGEGGEVHWEVHAEKLMVEGGTLGIIPWADEDSVLHGVGGVGAVGAVRVGMAFQLVHVSVVGAVSQTCSCDERLGCTGEPLVQFFWGSDVDVGSEGVVLDDAA